MLAALMRAYSYLLPLGAALGALLATASCVTQELLGCTSDGDCPSGLTCRDGACVEAGPGCSTELVPVYLDADNDGLGAGGSLGPGCPDDDQRADTTGDCDDGDPETGERRRFFSDLDGDGAGDPASPMLECVQLANSSPVAGDCDDADPMLRPEPGATSCVVDHEPALSSCSAGCTAADADAVLWGNTAEQVSSAAAGDFDGDGITDLAIGAYNGRQSEWGRVYLVFGPIRRGRTRLLEEAVILEPVGQYAALGKTIACPGDVDHDQLDDLLVGTHHDGDPDSENAGRAYLVLGNELAANRDNTGDVLPLTIDAFAAAIYTEDDAIAGVGNLGALGGAELDDTPGPDILLGAHNYTRVEPPSLFQAGAAFVVSGACSGSAGHPQRVSLAQVPSCTVAGTEHRGAAIHGSVGLQLTGASVRAADLDGVPPLDLLVSAAGGGSPEIVGFFGPVSGERTVADAPLHFQGVSPEGRAFATSGDLDGDGHDDLLLARETGGRRTIAAVPGPFAAGEYGVEALPTLGSLAGEVTEGFGVRVSAPGDLDGDGVSEVVINVPYAAEGGLVEIHSGATFAGEPVEAVATIRAAASTGVAFGEPRSLAADFDGDGGLDLLVMAPLAGDADGAERGAAYVFFGPWIPAR